MKKLTVCALLAAFFCSAVSAYNPPVNGENFQEIASPRILSGASSVTGGAIFSAGTDSLLVNPALTAGEQRVILNFADTILLPKSGKKGNALQAGILIPSKLFVFTGYFNLTDISITEMNLANSMNFKAGLSKEITDKLDVGLSLDGGLCWGNGGKSAIYANLGFLYDYGNLGFLKDFRYGGSLMNLGKTYGYPSPFTVKLGSAASLFKNDMMNIACSLDFTVPKFQNLITDIGFQASFKDIIVLSVAEKINLVEAKRGYSSFIPSIGISFRFSFNAQNNEYLKKNDWSQSEVNVYTAYKQMTKNINAISVGGDLLLGMEDKTAPVIDESVFDVEE